MASDPLAREIRFESRMSDSDALMWNIEKDPLLRSTILVALAARPHARAREPPSAPSLGLVR